VFCSSAKRFAEKQEGIYEGVDDGIPQGLSPIAFSAVFGTAEEAVEERGIAGELCRKHPQVAWCGLKFRGD
jgi:hypothetical protein